MNCCRSELLPLTAPICAGAHRQSHAFVHEGVTIEDDVLVAGVPARVRTLTTDAAVGR
jgi:hypothetical protein